jgi:cobalt/nickel transport protein
MSNVKKIWIAIAILAILSPLGIIVPKLFNAEGAWGEWGIDKIEKIAGFIPEGMKRISKRWKAPLSDYGLPGQSDTLGNRSLGYVISAIIGVAIVAGIMYLLTKLLVRKKSE